MPTTLRKNLVYRMALPLLAPGPGRHPALTVTGHPLQTQPAYLRLLHRHHVLGAAGLLSDGTRETLLLSSCERPRRMPEEKTLFRVASITKTACAMVTLALVDQERLSLDRPVAEVLPEGKSVPELKGITLRHLLSHTSGLADPPGLETALESEQPWRIVIPHQRLQAPGYSFRYSNFGFGLIGCMLEAVTGKPVSQVFEETLFRPLGMRATLDASSLPEGQIMPITRVLPWRKGYELKKTPLGRRPISGPDSLRHYGYTAGSMYTDIDSLNRMLTCIRQGGAPILSEKSAAEMIRQQATYGAISPTLSYGLGLLIIQDPRLSDHRLLGHQGFAYGCVDGAFWEEGTGRTAILLNGGASEARDGRLGLLNRDLLAWAMRKELPTWR